MISRFTIIIPVYNEEDNLARVEKELNAYLKISTVPASVLFVNDGSSDKSQTIIETICKRNSAYNFICFKFNCGLSAALKAGFDAVDTEFVGYIDSDLQTAPSDFNVLLQHIKNHALVTGTRTNRKDSHIKKMSSAISNSIRRAFTKDGVDDTGCPLKIFKTEYAKRIPMFKGLHRFLPAMILLQNGSVKQIPIQHFPRTAGTTKYGLRNRLVGALVDCFGYLWIRKRYINHEISTTSLKQ